MCMHHNAVEAAVNEGKERKVRTSNKCNVTNGIQHRNDTGVSPSTVQRIHARDSSIAMNARMIQSCCVVVRWSGACSERTSIRDVGADAR